MTPEERADLVYKKMCMVRCEDRWIMEHFHTWMKEEFERAILDEREACAKVAENLEHCPITQKIAQAIRARGEEK